VDLTAEARSRTAAVTGGRLPEVVAVRAGPLALSCLVWSDDGPTALLLHGNGGHAHWWDALDFAGGFRSPWLGVVLEVNNAWIERGLYDDIRARTAAIAVVQVSDFKVGTLRASERVVIGDGDIPLRRICGALAAAGYAGWYDIELLGPAIEAEGYESVVPRAIAAFRALWT